MYHHGIRSPMLFKYWQTWKGGASSAQLVDENIDGIVGDESDCNRWQKVVNKISYETQTVCTFDRLGHVSSHDWSILLPNTAFPCAAFVEKTFLFRLMKAMITWVIFRGHISSLVIIFRVCRNQAGVFRTSTALLFQIISLKCTWRKTSRPR